MDAFKIAVSKYALEKKIPVGDPFWRESQALPTAPRFHAP